MFVFQYNKEIYERFEKFRIDSQEDLYELLEADPALTDKELKNKYKQLVMKYHPDKNPDCKQCKEKFDKIMKAYEVLGNKEMRKNYDQNSGHITDIKSASLTLTPTLYNTIVYSSKELWVVQVYDSTNEFCHYFGELWEEIITKNANYARFARVDVWKQP